MFDFVFPLYYNIATGDLMILHLSDSVEQKLREVHKVDQLEILECFGNQTRTVLVDDREEHKSNPRTKWFISETDSGRRLKIVFIQPTIFDFVIRTAYEPDEYEEQIYRRRSRGLTP